MPTNETPLPGEPLPPDPVKILESLATIAETVGPQLEQALGSIAAEDMTPGENADQWVTDAQEAAERIQLAMRPILTAILELPNPQSLETTEEPPVEAIEADEPETDNSEEQLTEAEQGVLSFVRAKGQSVSVGEIADGTGHKIDDVIDKLHFISMLHRLSNRGLLAKQDDRYTQSLSLDQPNALEPTDHESTALELEVIENDILAYASNGHTFGIQELRANVPSVQNLSQEQYERFRQRFPKIRGRITQHMASIGLAIEWRETGRNKGKKYQMARPGQEPTPQESNLDKASEQIRHFKTREVMQVFEESYVTSLKFGQLRNLVASRLGITRKEAGAVIEEMLQEEQLHDADRKEGSRIISPYKPTQANSSAQESSKEKQPPRDAREKPTPQDPMEDHELDAATNVFDLLAEPSRHFQQGETVKKLYELAGGEMGLRTFRDVLSKLEARDLIMRDNRGNYGRARKGMLIKLTGQHVKEKWNLDKKAFLETARPAVEKN